MRTLLITSLLIALPVYADDTASIDAIVAAYYDVVSGPTRALFMILSATLHCMRNDALITKVFPDGRFQRHDLKTEQATITVPYEQSFFEYEVGRRVERYGSIAHVWSEFEMRASPDDDPYSSGINSISLYFKDDRWWISSWSTQYRDPAGEPPQTSQSEKTQ